VISTYPRASSENVISDQERRQFTPRYQPASKYQHGEDGFLQRKAQVGLGALPRLDLLPENSLVSPPQYGGEMGGNNDYITYLASFSMYVEMPENDTSMPLTVYGSSINFFPLQQGAR